MLFIGIDLSDKTFDSCISNSSGDVFHGNDILRVFVIPVKTEIHS